MEVASTLQGIPKILVRSSYPENAASDYLEDYEIQTGLVYELTGGSVKIVKTPWVYKDDNGVPSVTTYAATYVVNILTQIHGLLFGTR
jgi:hypothetical protein